MKKLIANCLLVTTLAFTASGVSAKEFDRIITFGDSLSDSGTFVAGLKGLYDDILADDPGLVIALKKEYGDGAITFLSQTYPLLPSPFYKNRITNGKNSADILYESLIYSSPKPAWKLKINDYVLTEHKGDSFATASAKAINDDIYFDISLDAQIDAFLETNEDDITNKDLFYINIGSNDLTKNDVNVNNVVVKILEQIERLRVAGAKNFLIANVADFADVPDKATNQAARENSTDFRENLTTALDGLRLNHLELNIIEFDTFNALKQTITSLESQGINVSDACIALDTNEIIEAILNEVITYSNGCTEETINSFAFLDGLHPTAKLNKILGRKMAMHFPKEWGENDRKADINDLFEYENPYTGDTEYFSLQNKGWDGRYGYFPIDKRGNNNWAYLGDNKDNAIAISQKLMDYQRWGENDRQAKVGSDFIYFNNGELKVFRLSQVGSDGRYWYFPVDGQSNYYWSSRNTIDPNNIEITGSSPPLQYPVSN